MKTVQVINGIVIKVGRKWLHIVQDGKNPKYPEQLLINEITKSLNLIVGSHFTLTVESESEKNYMGGYKWTHTPVMQEYLNLKTNMQDAQRQKEIAKWWSYVQQAFNEQRIYSNGVKKLHELKCYTYDSIIQEKDREFSINRAVYWLKENAKENRLYQKGVETLHSYNCHDYDDLIAEIKQNIIKVKQEKEQKYKESHAYIGYPEEAYTLGCVPSKGDTFIKNNKVYRVTAVYKQDDGMSFGYMSDYWYRADGVDITDTAEGQQALLKAAQKQEIKANKDTYLNTILKPLQTKYQQLYNELVENIEKHDNLKHAETSIPLIPDVVYQNSFDIYGSGKQLLKIGKQLWYIINNGSDGADWGLNHIKTGGAGAYGFRADYTPFEALYKEFDEVYKQKQLAEKKYTKLDI